MDSMRKVRPAWHFWVVAVIALLWNGLGAFDYYMTRTRDLEYLNQATDGHAALFIKWQDSAGLLVQIGWPVGVWLSLAGAVLLLARSRHAVLAYALSLAGAVASFVSQLTGALPVEFNRTSLTLKALEISGVIIFQLWYAWWNQRKGILA